MRSQIDGSVGKKPHSKRLLVSLQSWRAVNRRPITNHNETSRDEGASEAMNGPVEMGWMSEERLDCMRLSKNDRGVENAFENHDLDSAILCRCSMYGGWLL
jgi:hypothetical protein